MDQNRKQNVDTLLQQAIPADLIGQTQISHIPIGYVQDVTDVVWEVRMFRPRMPVYR